MPDVSLRTTMMAGFPGETRSDALESERFLRAACFDFTAVFCYSQEEGTAAAQRKDQVPLRTRRARAQRLRDIADAVGFERVQQLCGSLQRVLVCGEDEDGLFGRTMGQAPEVDGLVRFGAQNAQNADELCPGDIVSVRITDTICYDLFADVVDARHD
jgi:ribosomal protein S12 methylthiotransferase